MKTHRPRARLPLAGVAIVASLGLAACVTGGPGGDPDATAMEATDMEMDSTELRIAEAVPASRVDAGVLLRGLARHFEVTIYTSSPPDASQLGLALSAVAKVIPRDVAAVDFGVRNAAHEQWNLAAAFSALGIADASISEGGGAFTSYDVDWFRSRFGD